MGSRQTFREQRAPWPIRLANASLLALDRRRLSAGELERAARRATGLNRWADPTAGRRLEELVESVNDEGRLTPFGRLAFRQFLSIHLRKHLRVQDLLERRPEIAGRPLARPLFIVGWYRSGTTFLHNLMHQYAVFRAPRIWEMRQGIAAADGDWADPETLIRRERRERRIHRYLSPSFQHVHAVSAESPEECMHLFENACVSSTGFVITEAKRFAFQLLGHDLGPAYRFFGDQLRVLDARRPGGRWLLKWPYHLWHLGTLLAVFPDARVVWIHRDPAEVAASTCSMAAISRAPFCSGVDRPALGRFWVDYMARGQARGEAGRAVAPDRVLDVAYPELTSDPAAVATRIAAWAGVEDTDEDRRAVRDYLARPRAETAPHRYSPGQFSLDPGAVRERFASYVEAFGL